jgi:hypothetical protein
MRSLSPAWKRLFDLTVSVRGAHYVERRDLENPGVREYLGGLTVARRRLRACDM